MTRLGERLNHLFNPPSGLVRGFRPPPDDCFAFLVLTGLALRQRAVRILRLSYLQLSEMASVRIGTTLGHRA